MVSSIAIVGMGPRGISVLERIAAAELSAPVRVHVVDDSQIGAGRVWRSDQTRTLCMNTLAGAVTLFTEPNSTVKAPVRLGPTLFEWLQFVRGEDIPAQGSFEGADIAEVKTEMLRVFPPVVPPEFLPEIRAMRVQSNPSRALFGCYLNWVYEMVKASLPETVELVEHPSRAIALHEGESADTLHLENGEVLEVAATVLATGWQAPGLSPVEEQFAQAPGVWVAPGNPVEQRVDLIPDGADLLVRGMGMSFFDLMALTTIDRGGRFIEDASARSGLRYEASGREPHFYVSSGRGYPFLPKSDYDSVPPNAPMRRLLSLFDSLADAPQIDFRVQVLPAIVADAFEEYYRTLHRLNPDAFGTGLEEVLAVIDSSSPETVEADIAPHIPEVENRFSLALWNHPLAAIEGSLEEVTATIADFLAADIREAEAGTESALKAALWSMSCARRPAELLGSEGRYTWESRSSFSDFMALGTMVGSGPPLFRSRQLLALVDAGLITFVGQRPQTRLDGAEFVMFSPTTNTPVRSRYLVDAFLHSPDVRRVGDPLAASLVGRVRPFMYREVDGTEHETGSPETDPETRAVVRPDGSLDGRLHIIGIPTYAQFSDTIISPFPGIDPLFLQETGKAAAHALEVASGSVGEDRLRPEPA